MPADSRDGSVAESLRQLLREIHLAARGVAGDSLSAQDVYGKAVFEAAQTGRELPDEAPFLQDWADLFERGVVRHGMKESLIDPMLLGLGQEKRRPEVDELWAQASARLRLARFDSGVAAVISPTQENPLVGWREGPRLRPIAWTLAGLAVAVAAVFVLAGSQWVNVISAPPSRVPPSADDGSASLTGPSTSDTDLPSKPVVVDTGTGPGTGGPVSVIPTGEQDTVGPTAPAAIKLVSRSAGSITFSWAAATDVGTGVRHYRIVRDTNSPIEIDASTTFTDGGLAATTEYRYYVVAVDGAGHISPPTATKVLRTGPAPGGMQVNAPRQVGFGQSFSVSGGNVDDETFQSQVDLYIDGHLATAVSLQYHGTYQMFVSVSADGTVQPCGQCDPPFVLAKGWHHVHVLDINCGCDSGSADTDFEVV